MFAVADGLGAAERSDEGAKLAVETALRTLHESVEVAAPGDSQECAERLRRSFAEARRALEDLARTSGLPLREYGTTLILVAAAARWLAVGHVGDGAAVALFEICERGNAPYRR